MSNFGCVRKADHSAVLVAFYEINDLHTKNPKGTETADSYPMSKVTNVDQSSNNNKKMR